MDTTNAVMTRTYKIEPLPSEHRRGWRLRLIEDGREVDTKVYPTSETGTMKSEAYAWALRDGEAWVRGPTAR
jgi:hypothetical protein